MAATSVYWSQLNLNGDIITRTSKASLRCEWKRAGYVNNPLLFPLFTDATRCHVLIIAEGMEDIDLQVERDVTHMRYTFSKSRTELECIIFTVSLNRPATWAKNGGMFSINIIFSWVDHGYQSQHGMENLASNLTAFTLHGLLRYTKNSSPLSPPAFIQMTFAVRSVLLS
jgi:hypothetical protein